MPCQLGEKKENLHSELSVIFPSCFYHGKLVKSSPSSHKLARRFISPLTFSLEMPLGTWASALWREMTGLLLGAAVVESYSLASSPLCCPFSISLYRSLNSLSFSLWSLSKSDDSHLKGKRPRLTSVYFTLLISISFRFIIFKILWDNPAKSLVSGKNVHYDRWQVWRSLGFKNTLNGNSLAQVIPTPLFFILIFQKSDIYRSNTRGKPKNI